MKRRVWIASALLSLGCTSPSPYMSLVDDPKDADMADADMVDAAGGIESPSTGGDEAPPSGGDEAPQTEEGGSGGQEVILPGDGRPPCIRVDPPENLVMGDVPVGESIDSEALYIEPCGGRTAIRSIQMAEGSDPAITIAPESLPELPGNMPPLTPGEPPFQVRIKIICQPSTVGPLTGIAQIESNDPNHPSVGVIVTCNGIEPPPPDLRVEMTWHTPGDPDEMDTEGSDVDLSLVDMVLAENENNYDRTACAYNNPTPDWGVQGDPDDNPQHMGDDADGAGPETIVLRQAEDRHPYLVWIDYSREQRLSDFRGWGPSEVTVRVYVREVLLWTNQIPRVLTRTDDEWFPIQIQWVDGNPEPIIQDP